MQHLEKSFQLIAIKEKNLHKNIKFLIIESTRKSILNKSTTFFFANTHSLTNIDFGAPSHEYSLFTLICEQFINIRLRHYEKQFNIQSLFKNRSSLRQKLTKVILFNNI